MRTETVYKITKQRKWSDIICERRLSWLGHLFRLDSKTPAKKALTHVMKPMNRNRGRPKLDWLKVIKLQLTRDSGRSTGSS